MENQAGKQVANENEDAIADVKPRQRSVWLNIGILCSTMATIVLIAAFYVGYNRLLKINQDLANTANSLNSKVTADQTNIADLQKAVSNANQNLQTAMTSQQQAISELRTAATGKKESFGVSEAQYLTNLANDNLQLGDNLPLVIALLQTADQKVRDLADANVLPIRKALATDIAALQAVPPVDLAGVYARLTALNTEVDKLPLPNKRPAATSLTGDATDGQSLSWWRRGLHQSWEALQKIVIVRYNKPDDRPFIPPEQQDFLYLNLHANFAQAMSAVVQRQPDIYRASLQQAAEWIQRYFLTDSPVTQAALAALTQLQTVTLRPALPTLSASLQAFHDYFAASEATGKDTGTPANQS